MDTFYELPNGKRVNLEALVPEELELLLKVPTTVEQAKQIIKRNKLALRALEFQDYDRIEEGCPHCSHCNGFRCDECAWNLYEQLDEGRTENLLPCCHATFGGLVLDECDAVEVGSDFIKAAEPSDNPEEMGDWLRNGRAFLQGHVEWARAVILMKGIPWPDGVMSEKRRYTNTMKKGNKSDG